jgi:hypothetical protein
MFELAIVVDPGTKFINLNEFGVVGAKDVVQFMYGC